MQLYNPFTKSIEPLDVQDRPVTIYVCGITPYDTTHLGHAFTYTMNDILIRFLEYRGHAVRYVQNVTDIDDDILKRAAKVGEDWKALGDRWTRHFIEDMISLNVRPPDHYPRATEVIPEIITTVNQLIQAGVGYEKNGNVYYNIDAWPEFGTLSCMNREQMLSTANERGNQPDDPNKRHPLDFVLWQASREGEPSWQSPWGPGRPGWHIECSTMSSKYLAQEIDIHSGGSDLLFPHHCCEIAQIEPLTGKSFVRFWVHVAMVRHEGEKMSKSLGNLVMARDLLQTCSPDALRLYLAMHHYSIEWSYDDGQLDWAAALARRFTAAAKAAGGQGLALDAARWEEAFSAAMQNNLNSPAALSVLDDLAVNVLVAAEAGQDVSAAQQVVRALCSVFGLVLDAGGPQESVTKGWKEHLKKFAIQNIEK